MDFGTIETNLGTNGYDTQTQFHADIGKVFMNSYRFNAKDSDVYQLTQQVQEFYNQLVENPNLPAPQRSRRFIQYLPAPKKPFPTKRVAQPTHPKSQKRKPVFANLSPPINTMTVSQKRILGQNIRRLPRDSLKKVWQIVCSGNVSNEELKFDLDKLPTHVARQLERYVNSQASSQTVNSKGEVKESLQTNASLKQKMEVESDDGESFMVSEQSN